MPIRPQEGSILKKLSRLVALMLSLGACIQPGVAPTTTESSRAPVVPSTVSSTTSTEITGADLDALTLTERVGERCGFTVGRGYGFDIPVLHVGPVAFLAMDFDWTSSLVIDQPAAIKYVTVVDTTDGPVTISLDEGGWDSVALAYDTEVLFGNYERDRDTHLAYGHTSIVFPCDRGPDSQYNGGFIVAGPVCAVVRVNWGNAEASSAAIPFGVPQDSCALVAEQPGG